MNLYTNLADSIHFSTYTLSEQEYTPRNFSDTYYQTLSKAYQEKLLQLFKDWNHRPTTDSRIAFTFNQIADNCVMNAFLSNGDRTLHDQLIQLFQDQKAFLSTYAKDANNPKKKHDVVSYLTGNMLKHWKALCKSDTDEEPQNDQYLSSFFNMAAKKLAEHYQVDHPGNNLSRKIAAHYTMFGTTCKKVKSEMGEDDYIRSMVENHPHGLYSLLAPYSVQDREQWTPYEVLEREREDLERIMMDETTDITTRDRGYIKLIFYDIMSIGHRALQNPNNPLANNNGITLSKIITAVLDCDNGSILFDFYNATASIEFRNRFRRQGKRIEGLLYRMNPLPPNICNEIKSLSYSESSFLMDFRSKLKEYAIETHYRTDYYKFIDNALIPELVTRNVTASDNDTTRKTMAHLMRPFVIQFIDFCYNLHACIMACGTGSFEFRFYPYKTFIDSERNNPNDHNTHFTPQGMSASLNENPIILTHEPRYNLDFTVTTEKGSKTVTLPIELKPLEF